MKMVTFTQVIRGPERICMRSDIQPSDVKPSNVFVNYKEGDVRFSTVQLGDLGGTIPADSKHAKGGVPVGAPMWSSPEVIMETPWNTATDIWSFGTMVRLNYDLIYDLGTDY